MEISKKQQIYFSIGQIEFGEVLSSTLLYVLSSCNARNQYMQVLEVVFDADYLHGKFSRVLKKSHRSL